MFKRKPKLFAAHPDVAVLFSTLITMVETRSLGYFTVVVDLPFAREVFRARQLLMVLA